MRLPSRLLSIVVLATVAGGTAAVPSALEAQMVPIPADPVRIELEAVMRATSRYRDVEVAMRDGYVRSRIGFDFPLMGEHWVNRELLERPVDLLRPAVLQYIDVGGHRVLVGVAYAKWVRSGEPFPEGFTGDEDEWHAHDFTRSARTLGGLRALAARAGARRAAGVTRTGADGMGRLAMLHVWLWSENPDGVFANHNPALPYIRAGLPASWARPDDKAAPRAIALLAPGACRTLIDRVGWLTGVDPFPVSALDAACDRAAARLDAALRAGVAGDAFNAIAASVWLDFLADAREALAPAGLGELDHGEHGGP